VRSPKNMCVFFFVFFTSLRVFVLLFGSGWGGWMGTSSAGLGQAGLHWGYGMHIVSRGINSWIG